jgi:hypothetical protein
MSTPSNEFPGAGPTRFGKEVEDARCSGGRDTTPMPERWATMTRLGDPIAGARVPTCRSSESPLAPPLPYLWVALAVASWLATSVGVALTLMAMKT